MSALESVTPTHAIGGFTPVWWLPGGHAQTIWPAAMRPRPRVERRRETLFLADGDRIHLYWGPRRPGPTVLLMHGLGGSAEPGYILGLLRTLAATSFQGVAIEYRGAGGQPNAHRRFYHAGEWQDPQAVAEHLRRTRPAAPLYNVGVMDFSRYRVDRSLREEELQFDLFVRP